MMAMEILKVIQNNAPLRDLVTQSEPILYESFQRAVGDSSQIDLDGFIASLTTLFQRMLSGTRSKEVLHQLALEVDTYVRRRNRVATVQETDSVSALRENGRN
jgi:hypothetical protein